MRVSNFIGLDGGDLETPNHNIYLVASEQGPIKIGCTKRLRDRISQLNRESKFGKVALILHHNVERNAFQIERNIHLLLLPYRIKRDWFQSSIETATDAINKAIKSDCDDDPTAKIRNLLRCACTQSGTQETWAIQNSLSPAYISDVLKGHRDPGPKILKALGLTSETQYRKAKS
jgi:hypothetical protein